MARSISQRQKLILQCIKQHIDDHGYPPTVREIGEAVNLSSSSTVHAHLKALEEHGMILRDAVLTRAIKLVNGSDPTNDESPGRTPSRLPRVINVPIVGTVAAGKPRLAVEDIEDYFPLPDNFLSGDGFILKVRGDSMIEDGIHDADFVVVRRQQTANEGETVVAMIDGEATVKRFYLDKGKVRLQPANSALKPIVVDTAEILGKVVGLIRHLG